MWGVSSGSESAAPWVIRSLCFCCPLKSVQIMPNHDIKLFSPFTKQKTVSAQTSDDGPSGRDRARLAAPGQGPPPQVGAAAPLHAPGFW